MDTVHVLTILVSGFSLAIVLVGLPAQIHKNYRDKHSGQPLLLILIAMGYYTSQIGLFYITQSYLPLISFSIGICMWLIILTQHLIYTPE
jgi:hypothetical protein